MRTTMQADSPWRIGIALIAAAGLAMAAGAARAQQEPTWALHTVIEPPVLPDVDPDDLMAFGSAVSVGAVPWLVVGAPRADCAGVSGDMVTDAGRIFIYRRVQGVWQFRQSFCASRPAVDARYGSSVDVGESWLIVGAPGATTTANGRIELFRLDAATQQWTRQLSLGGTTAGNLGYSVAIDGNLAVAGEPGYDGQRGRLRSWKLTASSFTAEGYAPLGLLAGDDFGRRVAIYSSGCALPACTSYTDVVAVASNSRVYVAKRNATGWQSSQSLAPPAGTFFTGALDVGRYQVVASISVHSPSPAVGCPVGPGVRVWHRNGGSYALFGDICKPQSEQLNGFGGAVAVDRSTTMFYVTSPDTGQFGADPLDPPGNVVTYGGHPLFTYVDTQFELGLAPTGPAGIDHFNDAFGTSVSAFSGYMAVGAPWANTHLGFPGVGYVAVYWNCC